MFCFSEKAETLIPISLKLPEVLFGPGSQNYFQDNTKMLLATVTVLTCLGTNQGSRHKITRSHCILHWHILRERKKRVFTKECPCQSTNVRNFITS